MDQTTLRWGLGAVATLSLCGCSAAGGPSADDGQGIEYGQSVASHSSDSLTGCHGKASKSIPASGNYYLTSFGNQPSDDGIMSCGQYTKHGSWYYAASRQRYGCGSRIRIEAHGKCVVAETDDYGPDVCVENAAGKPIIDASPLVSEHLFGVSSAGYSDHLAIHVTQVSSSTPLGICNAPAQVCTPNTARCNSDGSKVETCASDGSGYATTQSCSPGNCANGACVSCAPKWTCNAWASCLCSNTHTRTCVDANQCGGSAGKPSESESCSHCGNGVCDCGETPSSCPGDGCESGCTPSWSCDSWSVCDCSGQQSRSCSDSNQCGTSSGKPAVSQGCDPCADGPGTCSQCSGTCQYGSAGENNDPCDGVAAETWRCVQSQKLGAMVSQVCRDGNHDGSAQWINFNVDPRDCAACCGSYVSGCAQ